MNYAKAISRIKTIGIVYLLLILSAWDMRAQTNDSITVAPDSSNFVTASLLISEPLHALYSVFGHATLRMECPTHHLDYVFTFESDPNFNTFMTGIAGKAKAKYIAVPTDIFISDSRRMGREVKQFELNLTHHEKQELWRLLDKEMMAGDYRNFNLLTNNCLTSSILNVQHCLIGEHLEWGPIRYPLTHSDGHVLRYAAQHSPWAEFLFITFIGSGYNHWSMMESRIMPATVASMLSEAKIINDSTGASRFVITDSGTTLVESSGKDKATKITPNIVFCVLLLLTLLITLAEWLWGWQKVANVYDGLLFTAQLLVGFLMLYVTFFSELFISMWNWYLIAFLPLPILFGLIRKKKTALCCWLCYSILLLLFILATPLIGLLDFSHQLITGSLLTRSISHYIDLSGNVIKKTNK